MFAFIYFLVMSYNYVRQQFISVELLFQGGNGWICSTSLIQRKHRGQHPNQLPEKALPMRCLLCRIHVLQDGRWRHYQQDIC